jgi:hypothetical protein
MCAFAFTFTFTFTLRAGVGAEAFALVDPPPRVRLHGSARIDAHWTRATTDGRLTLAGTVVDDAGRPVAGARLAVSLVHAVGPVPLALSAASPEPCVGGDARPTLERIDVMTVPADDAGRFCVRVLLAERDRYLVHLESRATGWVDAAVFDLSVDLSLAPVTLRFDPERAVLSLDEAEGGRAPLLEVAASTDDAGVSIAAVGYSLTLTNEAGTLLATATTNASGRARFAVEPARLGPPGRGELRVSFAGTAEAGASSHSMQVERTTRVSLATPDAVMGRLPAGSPEDGVTVRVAAVARCAASGCRASPTGTVEAWIGEAIVGAAPLENGEARVVATFAMPATSEVPVRLRFVPDAPWYPAAGEILVNLPVREPNPWRKATLAFATLAAIAWIVVSRLPLGGRGSRARDRPSLPQRAEAGVALVRPGSAAGGWTGTVRDAHDAFPIAGARVAIERRGFESIATLAEASSDERGQFTLPPVDASPGDELVVDAPLHAMLRRPQPAAGELQVALVLRKRALLDRLVAWAQRRGKPFDARPEPTPGHVRRAAGAHLPVARWADALERAAFGGAPVDAHVEREVDRLAPTEGPGANSDLARSPQGPGANSDVSRSPQGPAANPDDRQAADDRRPR